MVVLGDVGRSPRMQYHALALAQDLGEVDLVGYDGSPLLRAVREHEHIDCHLLAPPQGRSQQHLPRWLFLAYSALKVLGQTARLSWRLLVGLRAPDVILVQNPPAVPTLVVALLAARTRSAKLVVDWHNLGYSMLALRLGKKHPAVRLSRWYERKAGRRADAHICVSQAMRQELAAHFGIPDATVLYDQPAQSFAPTPLHLRHDLFRRLGDRLVPASISRSEEHRSGGEAGDFIEETAITCLRLPRSRLRDDIARYCTADVHEEPRPPEALLPFVQLRPQRPAVVVSSTSWTADEDFSLLLDAAVRCDEMIRDHDATAEAPFPHLLLAVSGQGPLRAHYEERIGHLALEKIHLQTLWLSPEDYPLLLGAADLGVCVHRSSSGFDLPMKVADMFGAGLPVCGLDYGPCLAEQIQHERNGLLFRNAAELAWQLFDLFRGFPSETARLTRLRRGVEALSSQRWSDGWKARARPLFRSLL